jgi:hypothetical protein
MQKKKYLTKMTNSKILQYFLISHFSLWIFIIIIIIVVVVVIIVSLDLAIPWKCCVLCMGLST